MPGSATEGNFDGELIILNNLLSSEITYDRGIIVGTYKVGILIQIKLDGSQIIILMDKDMDLINQGVQK